MTSGLDTAVAAVSASRNLSALLALLALAWTFRRGTPRQVLWLALAGGLFTWAVSDLPLARPYALGPSHDRLGNLALVQVVAAGNPPQQTAQPGQLSFEPFWGLFVAALSGFDPDRVLSLYDALPLLAILGFPLALWRLLSAFDPWERAIVCVFACLLCSSPLDFASTYRSPWALTFLLKPNHALGLVLIPLVLDCFVRAKSWKDRLAAGALLQLLAWVFVIYMAYVALGLVVLVGWSLLRRRPEARAEALDAGVAIGVNLLIASPYLLILLFTYPFLSPDRIRMSVPVFSPHLLEPTLRTGVPFVLALWGAVVLARRGDRLSRTLVAQFAGALGLWAFYLVLGELGLARERDEICYYVRFTAAILAGFGAWDVAKRAAGLASLDSTGLPELRAALSREPSRAALVLALAFPWSVPFFFDPPRMDRYFVPSLEPVPELYTRPGEFLRHQTRFDAVVAGDHEYARWTSALGARRVLLGDFLHRPGDSAARVDLERKLLLGPDPSAAQESRERWGVTHLLVTRELLNAIPELSLEKLESRADLKRVHFTGDRDREFVAIFEIVSPSVAG